MAKQPTSKTGTAKIRLIVLDLEVPEGDLSQIASAIQNAIRPTTIVQQRINSSVASPKLIATNEDTVEENEETLEEKSDNDFETQQVKPKRVQRPRKSTSYEVLPLDFDTDVSLKDFASSYPAKSNNDRFLVIATWFKEHRGTPSVTADHIYTGFRKLTWTVPKLDFVQPFRNLKKQNLMSSETSGAYEINHIGIDRVKALSENVN